MEDTLLNEYGDINHNTPNVESGNKNNKNKIDDILEKAKSEYLQVNVKIGRNKFKKIGCFMNNITGNTIKNAVTGNKYPGHLVGTFKEDLYFKVMLCSGENGQSPATLFYDSPSQYEKHMLCTVSDTIKNSWFQKLELHQ